MLITNKRRRRRPDYTGQINRHPLPIDPYMFPPGGIGDLAGATGITAIDEVIGQTETKIDALVTALRVGSVLAAVSAAGMLFLVFRDCRKYG